MIRSLKSNIPLSYIQSFFHYLYFFLPIWYAFETQYASPAQLGVLYALAHLVQVIFEVPTGALADIIGRKKIIVLGLLIEGFSYIWISQTRSFEWLIVGYIVSGIGVTFISGSDTALSFDTLKELKREKYYSRFAAISGIIIRTAIGFGALIGGYLFVVNSRIPYLLSGLSILFSAVFAIFYVEPTIDSVKFSYKKYLMQTRKGLQQLTQNHHIRIFSLYYLFIGGVTWYFMYFLNQAYATQQGFSSIQRSWLMAIIYLSASIIIFSFASKINKFRLTLYLLLPIILAFGYLLGSFSSLYTAAVSIFLVQLIGISRFSYLDQFANEEFDSKYRATALSALNMLVSFLFIGLTFMGGFIIQTYSSRALMFLLGCASIILIPVALSLRKAYRLKE